MRATGRRERALAFGGAVPGYDDYAAALAAASDRSRCADQPRGAEMLYTSGTTGRPRVSGRRCRDRQVRRAGDLFVGLSPRVFGVDADTVYLSPAPIYHAAPLRWCASVQALGGTVVMMERFDAEGALRAIEQYRVTHASSCRRCSSGC